MSVVSRFYNRFNEIVLWQNPSSPRYEVELRQLDASHSRKLISTDELAEAEELFQLILRHLLRLEGSGAEIYQSQFIPNRFALAKETPDARCN